MLHRFEHLQEAARRFPENAEVWRLLVEAYSATGNIAAEAAARQRLEAIEDADRRSS